MEATKLDAIWQAGILLNRGPIDGVQVLSANGIACQINSTTDAPVEVTYTMMEDNAIRYTAEQIGEDPADLEIFSLEWVMMPFVDASELPPPAPEDAYGND